MKYIQVVLLIIAFNFNLNAQTISEFLKNEGFAEIAYMAHPLGGYESGTYTIYDDYVYMEIYYSSGTTKLKINKYGNVFTSIDVLTDSFFWPAFSAVELIKNFALSEIEQTESSGFIEKFEQYLNKRLISMNGKELGCLLLTLSWLDY